MTLLEGSGRENFVKNNFSPTQIENIMLVQCGDYNTVMGPGKYSFKSHLFLELPVGLKISHYVSVDQAELGGGVKHIFGLELLHSHIKEATDRIIILHCLLEDPTSETPPEFCSPFSGANLVLNFSPSDSCLGLNKSMPQPCERSSFFSVSGNISGGRQSTI